MSDPGDEPRGPADFALECVRCYVAGRQAPPPPENAFYEQRAACFVTLKKHGELRGCIGTLEPAEGSLGQEIARNAHSSSMRDPRFPPVTADECEAVTCSVDVLSPSEACRLDDLDPRCFGVIVESGPRRGVLLPDLQGVDTVDAQVDIARQKAGIAAGQTFEVRRFRVTRYRQGDVPDSGETADPPGPPADD